MNNEMQYDNFKSDYKALLKELIAEHSGKFPNEAAFTNKMLTFVETKTREFSEASYNELSAKLSVAPDKHEFLLKLICDSAAMPLVESLMQGVQSDLEKQLDRKKS